MAEQVLVLSESVLVIVIDSGNHRSNQADEHRRIDPLFAIGRSLHVGNEHEHEHEHETNARLLSGVSAKDPCDPTEIYGV